MPLTQRPWSIKTYCLSKVWYKSFAIDLRVSDITSINSKVKSWLYSDQFEKPEEMVMFRPTTMGGLGMHSTKQKALSMLIRCFLETASNPTYLNSLYHTAVFNHHVLQDSTWPEPDTPPYFSEEFFSIIRNAHLHSSNDVTTMSSSQWYQYLLENQILKTNGSPSLYIPCRAERLTPAHDWQRIWRLARIKGLNSDQSSFLWRLTMTDHFKRQEQTDKNQEI